MVIDLVIVTAPYPPELRTTISPPATVWAMAPANVWQGATMVQLFESEPCWETKLREFWAAAGAVLRPKAMLIPAIRINRLLDVASSCG